MLQHILLATLVASSYIAVIRINVAVLLRAADRNDPEVIRHRMYRVILLCWFLLIGLPPLLTYGLQSYESVKQVYRHFGIIPGFSISGSFWLDVGNILWALVLMGVLYVGPIVNYLCYERQNIRNDFFFMFMVLTGVRDHVFAPITEEFVYRAAVLAVLKPVLTPTAISKLLPFFFGFAHLHHGLHLFRVQGYSLASVIAHVVGQLIYTTVFGLLANKIYLDTQCNMWSAVVVHGMCNLIGFPSFHMRFSHPRWFFIYCSLLCIGVYLFWHLLFH